jgi:hypothetical protein
MVHGRFYREHQNSFSYFFVEYIIVPCTKLSSFFSLFKFIIGINQKQLTWKTKICKIRYYRDHGGPSTAPHSLPQPSVTLSNPPGPLQPLAASWSPPVPPPWFIAVVWSWRKRMHQWESNSRKKKHMHGKFTLLTIKPRRLNFLYIPNNVFAGNKPIYCRRWKSFSTQVLWSDKHFFSPRFPLWFNTHHLPQAGRGRAPTLPGMRHDSFLIFFRKKLEKWCQWRVSCAGLRDKNLSKLTVFFKINILTFF